jgi:hypothetical protein
MLPFVLAIVSSLPVAVVAPAVRASDHLDTPTVIADPRADIGDLYAWTSTDGRRLNLVMTLVGHTFSDKLRYTFHVDSGKRLGPTRATRAITCTFARMTEIDCSAGELDRAVGDATGEQGLDSHRHRFRVFAGVRDDPFFNNVRGSRDAFNAASLALVERFGFDSAGCAQFDQATSRAILDRWQHTDGGPAKNYLAGWAPASIVVSIDLGAVNRGGQLLAVWAETATATKRIDRAGRPLTGNALLGALSPDDVSDALKERYNRADPATSAQFIRYIQEALGLYDGYDGQCGNQWLADEKATPSLRYRRLATLLADDRLWVNGASTACTQLFAVERAHPSGEKALNGDCGGRTPTYDAANVFRSMLANGTTKGIDDGLNRDEHDHSAGVFPFLAAPDSGVATKP